jgi:hypothetical protein
MKKSLILAAILAVVSVATAVAQPRAIGANIGWGIDVSYQHSLGEANMIDLSVNIPFFDGIGATATYDWINPFGTAIPWNYAGQWDWYLGVGAGVGIDGFRDMADAKKLGLAYFGWYIGAVGHVGVSYQFDNIPLQLSVDWRPNIGVHGETISGDGISITGDTKFNTAGLYSGITLGVRYLF